jgi:uncharacterized protein
MNTLPSYTEIISLHKKHAPSDAAYKLVFTHCQIVSEIAEQLIKQTNLSVNIEAVKVGCLLHDIGVYRLYLPSGEIDHKNYIQHGTLGFELLKEEGFSDEVCRIASCHTGVGLSKNEIIAEGIPIPPKDYFAETIEERLVMYADKFHTKSSPPKFMTSETYRKVIAKFGEAKVEKFKQFEAEFGVPELKALADKYGAEII